MTCYFGQFSRDRCAGRIDPCHIISQQVITREHQLGNPRSPAIWDEPNGLTDSKLKDVLADERNIVASCRYHHSNADMGWIDYEIPNETREFAKQYGLERFLIPVSERTR